MPAQHSSVPVQATLPGRVDSGDGAPASPPPARRPSASGGASAAGRRRSANGGYLCRERSVDLDDADAILATDWGGRTPLYAGGTVSAGAPRSAAPRRVGFEVGDVAGDEAGGDLTLDMVHRGAAEAARREAEQRDETRPDKEYMPGLPPRYRLRDLIQGDFAFADDGER